MEDVEEHYIFEMPKRSMPSSQKELMTSRVKSPVNRDPPATEAPLPANPAASGSKMPSVSLTSEALQQFIDYIVKCRGAHPSATTSQSVAGNNMNYAQDFITFEPPAFDGSSDDIEAAYEWIMKLESIFDLLKFQDEQRVRCAVFKLKGHALYWWKFVEAAQDDDGETLISWQEFKDMFFDRYCPKTARYEKEMEFLNLKQGNMTLSEYERQFLKLSRFAPELVDTQSKMALRFVMGLRNEIRGLVAIQCHTDYSSAFQSAQILDECMTVRSQRGHDRGSRGRKRKHQQIFRGP